MRFAPSPTGLLHVGNARIAVANFLHARRHGGAFLLRIDDTDRERSKAEYEAAIEVDLGWLGIEWDGRFRQSERMARYAEVAGRLEAAGRLYPCFESEEELNFKREQRLKQGKPPVYDRGALKMTAEQRARAEANGKRPYFRFLLSGRTVGWEDLVLGRRAVKLPSLSDPVMIRADGTPLYTFTSVVDDLDEGITDVVRGEDHVTNTGVQIDLMEAIRSCLGGGELPRFGHLPLLVDADGGKLSKRVGSLTVRGLRGDGLEAAALVGYLARLGTSEDPVAGMPAALAGSWEIGRVSASAARFDGRQLLALNRACLRELPFEAVRERLPAEATPEFWAAVRGNLDLLSEARGWWAVVGGSIVPPVQEGEADYLKAARAALPEAPWDEGVWRGWTERLKAETGRKGKALYRPLRLALTGEEHGPGMETLLPLMGRARVLERLGSKGDA